ncbi:helix-turn-helix domain-containing protein [Pedobacter africanus]|uniref:Helix-turn-helix n=1 Tax=Pedobacter africanus TaxID=151894 RepID=A0A1W1ZCS9_9SPHI|nr:Helix-turn-helix [Pedobacter africanus]
MDKKYTTIPINLDFVFELSDMNFKQLRLMKGKTLRQVSADTGISNPYLSQIETGKIVNLSFKTVSKLLTYYGFTITITKEATND